MGDFASSSDLPLVALRRHEVTRAAGHALDALEVDPAAPIVIGLSAGPDSTALLLALHALRTRRSAAPRVLVAAHVHHHLRGADADADARAAAAFAACCAARFVLRDIEPAAHPGNRADVARTLRRAALADVARAHGAPYVAVAHHADDQFETMLAALARGAALTGLAGMPPSRALDGCTLLRPLLALPRAALADLVATAGLEPRHDASNDDPASRRGRLRRDVTPVLDSMFPGAARHAARTAAALQALLRDAPGPVAPDAAGSWPRATLRALPPERIGASLRAAALAAAPALTDRLPARLIDPVVTCVRAADERPRHFDWPGALRVTVTAHTVTVAPPP